MASEAERIQLLQDLVETAIDLAREPDANALLERVLTAARRLTKAEAGTLYEREGNDLKFSFVQNDPLLARQSAQELQRIFKAHVLPVDEFSLAGSVASTREIVNIADAYSLAGVGSPGFNRDIDMKTGYVTCSVLAVPVLDSDDTVLGVLELINPRRDDGAIVPFDEDYEQPVRWLAAQAATAMRHRRLLEDVALTDRLTELPNQRYLLHRLREEVERHRRFGHPVATIFITLDDFSGFNERLGRETGEGVLREVARRLLEHSRPVAIAARWRDDMFAVILPNTSKSKAITYARRIKRVIDAEPFGPDQITASVAVVSVPDDAGSVDAVIGAGDRMREEAKARSGNAGGTQDS